MKHYALTIRNIPHNPGALWSAGSLGAQPGLALWQDHQHREVGGAALGGGRLALPVRRTRGPAERTGLESGRAGRNAGSDPEPAAVTSPGLSAPACEVGLLEGVGEIRRTARAQ